MASTRRCLLERGSSGSSLRGRSPRGLIRWTSCRRQARERSASRSARTTARPAAHWPRSRMRRARARSRRSGASSPRSRADVRRRWPRGAGCGTREAEGVRREVAALPGVFQTSVDELVRDAERARRLGLGGIILFGLPAAKDATGSEAYDEQGIVQQAARAVKRATPELLVIGDACLCEYTDHGHCGVVQDGEVDNDASVYLLGKVAVTQARAGIDIVAHSDMMDGWVAGIRKALDAAGF